MGSLVPEQLFIETSNICNANCIFCGYQFDKRKKKIMDGEMFNNILTEYKGIGGKVVNFTPYAGEVFMDKDFLKKVQYSHTLGFQQLNTYSNLTLAHKFGSHEILSSGLTSLAISTAPFESTLYEKIYRTKHYEQMLENLVDLLTCFQSNHIDFTVKNIRVEFRANMSLRECRELPDFKKIEHLLSDRVTLSAMTEYDSWMGMIKPVDFLPGMKFKSPEFEKKSPCDRLFMLKINSDGSYRACGCRYDYSVVTDEFLIGHISDMSILEAYNSEILESMKNSFPNGCPPDACKKCSWYESFRYSNPKPLN
ncbi:MAG: MoaA/NifB/PqqE/SkfB family radical SAM enzyme [Paraglaciecola sp.]